MKLNISPSRVAIALAMGLTLTACGGAGGGRVTTGSSPTATTGAAAGGTSVGANSSLELCASPLGTLAVDDGRGKVAKVTARKPDGREVSFDADVLLLTPKEVDYFRHGGLLQYVLRQLAAKRTA